MNTANTRESLKEPNLRHLMTFFFGWGVLRNVPTVASKHGHK
jgi:hypothetical protein